MPADKQRPYSNICKVEDHARVYNNICLRFATWGAISSSKERMIIKTKDKRAKRRTQDTSLLKCTNQSSFNQNLIDSSSPKLLQYALKDLNLKAFEVNVLLSVGSYGTCDTSMTSTRRRLCLNWPDLHAIFLCLCWCLSPPLDLQINSYGS